MYMLYQNIQNIKEAPLQKTRNPSVKYQSFTIAICNEGFLDLQLLLLESPDLLHRSFHVGGITVISEFSLPVLIHYAHIPWTYHVHGWKRRATKGEVNIILNTVPNLLWTFLLPFQQVTIIFVYVFYLIRDTHLQTFRAVKITYKNLGK